MIELAARAGMPIADRLGRRPCSNLADRNGSGGRVIVFNERTGNVYENKRRGQNVERSSAQERQILRGAVMRMALVMSAVLTASISLCGQGGAPSGQSGWIDIMPEVSFADWTRVAIPPDKALDPVSQWSVDATRRVTICEGNHGHEWLRYNRELGDFILHVEWRFTKGEGLKGYNSGVFVRNSADGRVWHQAQVGAGNDGYLFGQTLIGGRLSEMKFSPKPTINHIKPPGEWNTYEIRCQGPNITLFVNGKVSAEFSAPEVPKGYFGLEAEGFHIEFRNIRYKLLP